MLYTSQKRTANLIGIALGIALLGWLLISHAPSTTAGPRLGANIKLSAWVGAGLRPAPIHPKNIISDPDLTGGEQPATGVLTLRSETDKPVKVGLRLDKKTGGSIKNLPFTRSVTVSLGANGSLGSSTLEQLATQPAGAITVKPGDSIQVPVAVAVPLEASEAVAGQTIRLTLIPEQIK